MEHAGRRTRRRKRPVTCYACFTECFDTSALIDAQRGWRNGSEAVAELWIDTVLLLQVRQQIRVMSDHLPLAAFFAEHARRAD